MGSSIHWGDLLPSHTTNYVGAAVIDGALNIRAVDDEVVARSGFTRQQLTAMTALDVVHPDDFARAAEGLAETQTVDGTRLPGLYRLLFADGDYDAFEVRTSNVGTATDPAIAIQFFEATDEFKTAMFADGMVQMMQILVESGPTTAMLQQIADFAQSHVRDMTMSITAFGPDGSTTTLDHKDLPADVVATNQAAHPLALPPHVRSSLEARLQPSYDSNTPGSTDDLVPGRVTSVVVADDVLLGYVEAFRPSPAPPTDLEWLVYTSVQRMVATALVRRRLDRQLRFAADHDPLTGLLNRRRLLADMSETVRLEGTALLLVDLDSFSWINNTLGHAAGDKALVSVAEQLKANSPQHSHVSRWGGDEFVVWIPAETSIEAAGEIAEQIQSTMIVPIMMADRRTTIRCSIGATVIRSDEGPEQAVNRADLAMYEAKKAGGDQVRANHAPVV